MSEMRTSSRKTRVGKVVPEQFDGDVWRRHACADVKNVSAQPVFGILRPGGKTGEDGADNGKE